MNNVLRSRRKRSELKDKEIDKVRVCGCAGERENVKERSLNREKVREIIKEKWSKKWELREQIIKKTCIEEDRKKNKV